MHRGRLIDHIQIVTGDLAASRRFYEAVLGVLGIALIDGDDNFFHADELVISLGRPTTGRCHIAFQAADQAMVEAFHAAGLAAGGRDHGGPGKRSYHDHYYAAFLLDPDGNNIEAVYNGPEERSASSLVINRAAR